MNNLAPISVCIMAKDESEMIERCIASIISYVEEVIVLDTGSTDDTIRRARQLNASVYRTEWSQHFGDSRNLLMSYATQPWILMMDADEVYAGKQEELLAFCATYDGKDVAGKIIIANHLEQGQLSQTTITRIFPNHANYKYKGRIHEQLLYCARIPMTITTAIKFNHYGYLPEVVKEKGKIERNITFLMDELFHSPNDIYLLFQIARTYYVSKDYSNSKLYYEKIYGVLNVDSKEQIPFLPSFYLEYGYTLINVGDFQMCSHLFLEAINLYPDYTDLYFMFGICLTLERNSNKINLISEMFEYCLHIGEADSTRYETVEGVGSYKSHYNLAIYNELIGNKSNAMYHYEQASSYNYELATKRLSELNNTEGIVKEYEKV